MKLPKMPKIKLPTKQQVKAAMPTVMAVTSVVGSTISTVLFIKESMSASLKIEQLKKEGATKKEIILEVAPKFILPTVIFAASQLCTIECNILNKKQQVGLATALVSADYRLNKAKGYIKDEPSKSLPACPEGKMLFYDEYLETGKQDGYYACRESDWWKAYAKFIINLGDEGGVASFYDFYKLLIPYDETLKDKLNNVGSWVHYAEWDLADTCSQDIMRPDEMWIDDTTKYYAVNWLFPPVVSEEAIMQGLV